MVVIVEEKTSFPSVRITSNGVISSTGIFRFDTPKTIEEHHRDFCELGQARLLYTKPGRLALECGVESGLIVIEIGNGRGSFVPKLKPGRYGVEHTSLGNLVTKTKRVIDVNDGTCHLIFGIVPEQWQDGLSSCALVKTDLEEGRGAINLLADGSAQPIEPTPGLRFVRVEEQEGDDNDDNNSNNGSQKRSPSESPTFDSMIVIFQFSKLQQQQQQKPSSSPPLLDSSNNGKDDSSSTITHNKRGLDNWISF